MKAWKHGYRFAGIALLALAFGVLVVGCKKKTQPEKNQGKQAVESTKKTKRAASESTEEAMKSAEQDQEEGSGQDDESETGETEDTAPPAETKAESPEEEQPGKRVGLGPGKAGPPGEEKAKAPTIAVDHDRLEELFIEMWCAEQRGASPDQLMEIYTKYDYPPIGEWYSVWNRAVEDRNWALRAMNKAKGKCPKATPSKEDKAKKPLPPKRPAPPEGDTDKKAESPAERAQDKPTS